jgi:hypothetical protein
MTKKRKQKLSVNARNEQLKLVASFYNNLSVALLVTGFVIPYLSFFDESTRGIFLKWLSGEISSENILGLKVQGVIVTAIVAITGAIYLQVRAREILSRLI